MHRRSFTTSRYSRNRGRFNDDAPTLDEYLKEQKRIADEKAKAAAQEPAAQQIQAPTWGG